MKTAKELALMAARALSDKKGREIQVLEIGDLTTLAAFIAVNLAVMNLLPLPALDGGKIFFLVVNALSLRIIRRQIPARFENYVHLAGFVLLMGFMLVITFHDVIKLFQ